MGSKSKSFLLFLLLIAVADLFAQNHEFNREYMDVSSGLSNNYVSKIISDDNGLKWFATEGGVNTFDGINYKIYKPGTKHPGLANENIETLYKDSRGWIWVGTKSGGISKFDPSLETFTNFNHLLKKPNQEQDFRVISIVEDDRGNIWVATWSEGLFIIDPVKEELIEKIAIEGSVVEIVKDKYGNIWIAEVSNIFKFDPSEDRLIKLPIEISGVMTIYSDEQEDRMLVGGIKGLYAIDRLNFSLTEIYNGEPESFNGINAITRAPTGEIWVGSWRNGLFASDKKGAHFQKVKLLPDHLNNNNYEVVLDILVDNNGQVWATTGYGGVVKLVQKRTFRYVANTLTEHIGLPDNNIQSIYKDQHGYLWCGTWGGGVAYSRDEKSFTQLAGIGNIKVSCFLQVGNQMLVGTRKGIYVYDIENPYLEPKHLLKEYARIKTLYLDQVGKLWVGTQQNGLLVFDYKQNQGLEKYQVFETDLLSKRISFIQEDKNNDLWVGTYNGLYRYDRERSVFKRMDNGSKNPLPSVIILSMFFSENNELWLGVPGGLVHANVTEDHIEVQKVYDVSDGLANDYIVSVTMDQNKDIWVSSALGLALLRRKDDVIIDFGEEQGMSYSSMNIGAVWNDQDKLYFGAANGLIIFEPLTIDLAITAPQLVFTSLKIDNEEVSVGEEINGRIILEKSIAYIDKIELTYEEQVVSLSYVSADYLGGHNLNFHYRILGFNDDWINNKSNHEVSFTGLNAGDYKLEIKGTRNQVDFGEVQSIKLSISPPPWASTGAIVTYIVVMMVVVLVIRQAGVNRTKLKGNLEMAKLGQEKEHELTESKLRFFTNISHELRTPLTLIISPLTEILKESKLSDELREKLNFVENNAMRLLQLINQLLDFRKADKGLLNLQVASGDIVKFFREIFLSFKGHADSIGISYHFESSMEKLDMTYDRDKMEIVICNLLSNAFKYTSIKGKISLNISANDTHCEIVVKDSGKGISKEYQDKIFNRFFQIKDTDTVKVVGSGIGLSLSQKIAELHHGEIKVSSREGKGTEFIVTIPRGNSHFSKEDFLPLFKDSEHLDFYKADMEGQENDLGDGLSVDDLENEIQTLLLIDDNLDIRTYLESLFHSDYKVVTAANGKEGLSLAEEIIPDLIISDVMMPEMDGIELTKILKSNIITSHIPVILLTARTSTVHEVDGLKTGADDYVKKPFDATVIKSRVQSQLDNRRKVRAHLLNKVRFEPDTNIIPTDFEEKFIQDASNIVDQHLDDSDFGVDILSETLCMSQSTLYRKIKSLTGMSITGFIRSIRLKKASEILLTHDLKLSAVGYMVGFNDYKYFKKSFQKQFGKTPKEYQEENMAKNK
ncbi:MAG: ATP-binding protein [Reichenbachiella sp.]